MTTERAAAELRAWVAEEARRAREFDAGEHRREAFPQTATGRALAAAPLSRSGRGPLAPGPLIVQREPSDGVTDGAGQCITVTADTTVPDGGGYITFDTIVSNLLSGFGAATAPTSELAAPWSAVSQATILLTWTAVDHDSTWKGSGAHVALHVAGTEFHRWTAPTTDLPVSRLEASSPKLPVGEGDGLKVWVQQDSGASQAVKVTLSWGMEDPTVVQYQSGEATVGTVTFKTAGNGSDLQFPDDTEPGDLLLAGFTATHTSKAGNWTWDLSGHGWTKVGQYDTAAVHTSLWHRQATGSDSPGAFAGLPDSVKSLGSGQHFYQMIRVPQVGFGSAGTPVEYPSGVTSMAASGGSLVWFGFVHESTSGSPAPTGTTGTVKGYNGALGYFRAVAPDAGSSGLSWGNLVIGAAFPFTVTGVGGV